MARCRMVVPETVRLPLSDGDWIEVKKRLTYGETKRAHALLVKEVRSDGSVTPNLEMIELAQVCAYLVEWSLVDFKGKQIPIDTEAQKRAAVEAQDAETVQEIVAAITAHIDAVDAEKNVQAGERSSSSTSPSAD